MKKNQHLLFLIFICLIAYNGLAQRIFDPTKCHLIENKASRQVLTVFGGSSDEGTLINQFSNVDLGFQRWFFTQAADGKYNIKSKYTDKLMTVRNCDNSSIIQQYTADGTTSQKWRLESQTDGSYKIFAENCNKPIKVEGGSISDQAKIGIGTDDGTDAFKWFIKELPCEGCNILPEPNLTFVYPDYPVGTNNGSITITNLPAGASSSLDYGVFTKDKKVYSGLAARTYTLTVLLNGCELTKTTSLVNRGVSATKFDPLNCYFIVNKATNKVLEVKDASQTEGAQVYQWSAINDRKHQLWRIVTLSDGTLNLVSKNSGKFIDAPDCAEGATIKQYAGDGTSSQNWRLETNTDNDGSIKLRNVSCDKLLRVEGGNTTDGANVGIKIPFESDVFKWYIKLAPCAPDACPPTPILSRVFPTATSSGSITIENLGAGVESSLEGPLIEKPVFTANKKAYTVIAEGQYKIKLRFNGCVSEINEDITRRRTSVKYFPGFFRIINKATGKALTVKNDSQSDAAAIVQATYTGSANQQWIRSQTTNFGSPAGFSFFSKSSKKALRANDPATFCVESSTPTYQSSFLSYWYPVLQSDGSYKILKSAPPGCIKLVLQVANNSAETVSSETDANNDFSKWLIEDVSTPPPAVSEFDPNKCYRIVNKATSKVLEVKGGLSADGTQIYQWASSTSRNQQLWKVSKRSDGKYNLIAKSSGKLMDAPDCTEGGIIKLYGADGTNSQNWALEPQTGGFYKILNQSCNKFIRVEGSNTADGHEVGIKNDFGAASFVWSFQEANCTTGVAALSSNETFAFEAQAVEGRAKLQWVTNTNDKDYFNIERQNANGEFEILDRQNAFSTENGLKTYTFTDFNPLEGDNFYRINTISNGNTPPQYSDIKKLSFLKTEDVGIYPNPASDFIALDLRKYEGKKVILSVYNQVGKLLKSQVIEKASSAPVHLDMGGQGDGQMLLRVSSEGRREVMKNFLIQH
jgi:hypothetical protein